MKEQVKISDGDFFTQTLKVGEVKEHSWEYCKKLSSGKKVLHIGCSDYPIFNLETNMHLFLIPHCKEIWGVDPHGIEELQKHNPNNNRYCKYICDLPITNKYDIILVPNILEHLVNPGQIITDLFALNFKKMFVLVPNYSISNQAKYENGIFTERVHPDHYAWYSPYVLYNLFSKYIHHIKFEMNFFDNHNMISILITIQ